MLKNSIRQELAGDLAAMVQSGLFKGERPISGAQGVRVSTGAQELLNFCANNYLGLAEHPDVVDAAATGLREYGFGMASVRFICGTQDLHRTLEGELADLLGTEAAVLYPSCFDANGGLFETLLGPDDVVISDALNHASIIDGVRLCKAKRLRYANRDMAELRDRLVESAGARRILIVTDGVFSMDGYLAPLPEICDLAEEHGAMVMVDDSHAVGVLGPHGAGTPAHLGVTGRVDIVTGTLGKALGGGSGGYVAADGGVVELLRQRSRPYLFSNSVPPPMVAGARAALAMARGGESLRAALSDNTALFRTLMSQAQFELLPGEHPIVPVMFGDEQLAARVAEQMLALGVYVVAFSFPVVPRGAARIRVQLSAAHSEQDIRRCVAAFGEARSRCA